PCVAQEELPPLGVVAPVLECPAIDQRPPIEVVVDLTRENEAIDERRAKEQLLEPFKGAKPDQVAPAEPHQILADVEVPVFVGDVSVSDEADLPRMADAEPVLV